MIAEGSHGNHQAAFIAVALSDHHRTGARFSRLNPLSFRNVGAFNM
jgi:hypothetical protein